MSKELINVTQVELDTQKHTTFSKESVSTFLYSYPSYCLFFGYINGCVFLMELKRLNDLDLVTTKA